MAIFTPRGLKIRLPLDYSFALMKRLYPSVRACKVLRAVEGFELLPNCMGFIAAMVCFLARLSPIATAGIVAGAHIWGYLVCVSGVSTDALTLRISIFFSLFHGYGLYLVFLGLAGFFLGGWQYLAAYISGRLVAAVINGVVGYFNGKRIVKKMGEYMTLSEINFLNAYIYYARREKASLDLSVSDDELKEESWRPIVVDLVTTWPNVVDRFTAD